MTLEGKGLIAIFKLDQIFQQAVGRSFSNADGVNALYSPGTVFLVILRVARNLVVVSDISLVYLGLGNSDFFFSTCFRAYGRKDFSHKHAISWYIWAMYWIQKLN